VNCIEGVPGIGLDYVPQLPVLIGQRTNIL
jgi:hypothetical protein